MSGSLLSFPMLRSQLAASVAKGERGEHEVQRRERAAEVGIEMAVDYFRHRSHPNFPSPASVTLTRDELAALLGVAVQRGMEKP